MRHSNLWWFWKHLTLELFPSRVFALLYRERCFYRIEYGREGDCELHIALLLGGEDEYVWFQTVREMAFYVARTLYGWDREGF